MVRNYIRKTNRQLMPLNIFNAAKKLVEEEGRSIRDVAKLLSVNDTLRRRLQKGTPSTKLGRFSRTFTIEQEEEIANYCRELDQLFFGLTLRAFRKIVFQYVVRNGIQHPFNVKLKLAGRDFTKDFLKRHKLSMRTPMKTSVARVMGFNKFQVNTFFENLADVLGKYNFLPNQIYNMDESGFNTVPNYTEKVISPKGQKLVSKVVSADRGTLITAVCCFSAQGTAIPPLFIFPRKRKKPELLNGAPLSSIMDVSDSGYMNSEIFLRWMEHFVTFARPTATQPVLLILDNHCSHVSLDAVLYARQNSVIMLSIPPHTSQRLQPLDRGIFGKLKESYGQNCDDWLNMNPGYTITQQNFCSLFSTAYEQYSHPRYAIAAFKECGIVPFNRNIFSDVDFLPSTVTCQENTYINTCQGDTPSSPLAQPLEIIFDGSVDVIYDDLEQCIDAELLTNSEIIKHSAAVPSTSSAIVDGVPSTSSVPVCDISSPTAPAVQDTSSVQPDPSNLSKPIPSISSTPVSIVDIQPKPKIKKPRVRSNRAGKSTILTSTPEKDKMIEIIEERRKKLEELAKKREMREQKKIEKEKVAAEKIKKRKMKNKSCSKSTLTKLERRANFSNDETPKPKRTAKFSNDVIPEPKRPAKFSNDEKPKPKSTSKVSNDKTPNKRAQFSEKDVIKCPGCEEMYMDPPTEDWIQCMSQNCQLWWHEECCNVDAPDQQNLELFASYINEN